MTALTIMDRRGSNRFAAPGRLPPELVDGETWDQLVSVGHRIGPDVAGVTVVVFSDFECPMCAEFATRTYPDFRDHHDGQTALVYRHWPLTNHRFSYPAARAAECAAVQGRFEQIHDLLYAEQRLFGLKSFEDFAVEVGVANLADFTACIEDQQPSPAIERDIDMVRSLGGTGTPTVVVNGWLLRGGVSPALLDSIAAISASARR